MERRVEELESERKKGRDTRQVTESSSESEEGGGKWRWDGENWWFKVNHRGPINSRLRRKISRMIGAELRARVEWLETERAMQRKTQVGEAPGIQTPGRSSQEPAVSQDNDFGIFM